MIQSLMLSASSECNKCRQVLEDAGSNPDQQKKAQEQRQAQEDMKNSMLSQLLDQDARARLNTLKLSKPEKAQMVEGMIIRMAQMGQIGGKLDDANLVKLLESLNQQMPRSNSAVKFDRRRAALDSDEDDEDYGI
ncbi:AGAP005432-PA-like protein [Anopheles sinensis]|uniref:AGAP005432-PA-like protein n=1 Tax=Anopheles sinensis TaxID=74873 RepID=A0A084VD90_ANOSI|nr:AGAP005432-PA-like protein [Anopheles sinensis]